MNDPTGTYVVITHEPGRSRLLPYQTPHGSIDVARMHLEEEGFSLVRMSFTGHALNWPEAHMWFTYTDPAPQGHTYTFEVWPACTLPDYLAVREAADGLPGRAVERVKQTPPAPPVLVYDPPYATPAADEVAWHLVKYLRDDVEMTCEGETFTLRQGSQVVQIAATVGYALAVHDRLYALSLSHPSMFSERGKMNLRTLASPAGGAA